MKTKGIRILDKIDRVVKIDLKNILEQIQNGFLLSWSILYFYGSGHLNMESQIPILKKKQINQIRAFC